MVDNLLFFNPSLVDLNQPPIPVSRVFRMNIKLDGVALLITDPPPTSFTNLSNKEEEEKKKQKMLNVTCDM